jgi:hypothetical protein
MVNVPRSLGSDFQPTVSFFAGSPNNVNAMKNEAKIFEVAANRVKA